MSLESLVVCLPSLLNCLRWAFVTQPMKYLSSSGVWGVRHNLDVANDVARERNCHLQPRPVVSVRRLRRRPGK